MNQLKAHALTLAPVAILLGALTGCQVNTHRNSDNSEDVKIATPFGGMSVKTDDAAVQANVGLAVYPGAVAVKKLHSKDEHGDHDSNAADINMSFGNFHLGVKALSYQTSDSPDKVLTFYRKEMSRYGLVLQCKDHKAVGTPTETKDGLTCSDSGKHVEVSDDSDTKQSELKAGSKLHQHIVSIEPQGSGTKFGLVALDLPGHLGLGDDDDSSQ